MGGVLADRIGGPTVVGLGGLVGAACALAYVGLHATVTPTVPRMRARGSVGILRRRPVLWRVARAHAFYGAGLIAAVPLFALVHVDRLGLTLADVGVIGLIGAAFTTLTFPIWGVATDRFGPLSVLRSGAVLGLVAIVCYAIAPVVAVLWVAAAALGAATAATDTAVVNLISDETPLDDRASAIAGWNGITGVWGVSAPLAMGRLVQAGWVGVQGALLMCAALAAVGVVLYARVPVPLRDQTGPGVADRPASRPTSSGRSRRADGAAAGFRAARLRIRAPRRPRRPARVRP